MAAVTKTTNEFDAKSGRSHHHHWRQQQQQQQQRDAYPLNHYPVFLTP